MVLCPSKGHIRGYKLPSSIVTKVPRSESVSWNVVSGFLLFPIGSMGRTVYLPIWLNFMVNIGKYTSPMHPVGLLQLRMCPEMFPSKILQAWYNSMGFLLFLAGDMFEMLGIDPFSGRKMYFVGCTPEN